METPATAFAHRSAVWGRLAPEGMSLPRRWPVHAAWGTGTLRCRMLMLKLACTQPAGWGGLSAESSVPVGTSLWPELHGDPVTRPQAQGAQGYHLPDLASLLT